MAADGILGSKGGAAQHDEDQDKVGEDVVVNELVAAHTDPVEKSTAWMQPMDEGLLQAWGLLGGEPGGGWPKARMFLFSTQEEHYGPPLVPQSLQLACGVSSLGLGVPQRPFHQILTHGVTVLPKMKGELGTEGWLGG